MACGELRWGDVYVYVNTHIFTLQKVCTLYNNTVVQLKLVDIPNI